MEHGKGQGNGSPAGRLGGVFTIVTLVNAMLVLALLTHSHDESRWGLITAGTASAAVDQAGGSGGGVVGPTVKLPDVMVKLQVADADLYVEAAFELEVATEQDKEAVHKRLSRLQEAEIGILSGLTPADVRGSHQIEHTKERLLKSFRGVLPGRDLRALYVNSLIVD